MNSFINIEYTNDVAFSEINKPYYFIALLKDNASFSLDFNTYDCTGNNILFLSPYQLLKWHSHDLKDLYLLQFHGDFYCIEYHKQEVACNGILFNNIYQKPFITVSEFFFNEIVGIFNKIKELESSTIEYDLSVMKSYLQLVLALSSKQKQIENKHSQAATYKKRDIFDFKSLLDQHFIEAKSVAYYADKYSLSVNAFSKK